MSQKPEVGYRVVVREQVNQFFAARAPHTRRRIKQALQALEMERGDCWPLRERLSGYHRLRVGSVRIIFRYLPGRTIECVFAEQRSLVYQLFEREIMERLRHDPK